MQFYGAGIRTVSKMECGLAREDSKVVRDPGASPEFTTKNYEAWAQFPKLWNNKFQSMLCKLKSLPNDSEIC